MNSNENDARLPRREFLGAAGAAALAPLFPGNRDLHAARTNGKRKRTLRLAHLTDVHLQPERGADKGFASVLKHVQSLDDPPKLIVTGGDSIMDGLAVGSNRAKLQWNLWQRTLKAECSLPVASVIGNHDVWGWNKTRSKTTGKERQWGKQWALDVFGVKERFRSFDRGGWHFILLDSIHPDEETVYRGELDEKQFAWLEEDLKRVAGKKPVIVVSHIPILSVARVEFTKVFANDPKRSRVIKHVDAQRIVRLFKKHPNVKLCLSGHLHLTERIEYAGVTYMCSGAVCGNWWKGNHHHVEEGYNVIDLYDDGTAQERYVGYGWKARK